MGTRLRGTRILTTFFIIIMIAVFLINLLISSQCNRFWVAISGGGNLTEYMQLSREDVFGKMQLYRLATYGFLQTSIIHLLANIIALWYIGGFFEEYVGRLKYIIVFTLGLIIPGILLLLIYPNAHIYGASPAIYTCIGMLVNQALRHKDLSRLFKCQSGYRYIVGYFFLGNLPGVCTLVFHFLGFVVGLILGFAPIHYTSEKSDRLEKIRA